MKQEDPAAGQDADRVGFVVIGRNEGERLVRCLDSLKSAGAAEIVYVDSGSTDGSVLEAEKRGARVVKLDLSRPFTAGRARNEGFEQLLLDSAEIDFVQFIDGDCELAPDWLSQALHFLNGHTQVAIVCGRRQEKNPDASPYNKLCDIEWNTPIGEAEACGGDSLVRAGPFRTVGGFSDRLIAGEEPELCHRLRAKGWKIWRIDADMTLHDAAMYRLSQWWMRGVRSGFGYAQVWAATRQGKGVPLYGQQIRRAIIWAGALPAVALAASLCDPRWILGLTGIYALQVARIAFRLGVTQRSAWSYGFFAMLAKFPELQGAARYLLMAIRGGQRSAILYK